MKSKTNNIQTMSAGEGFMKWQKATIGDAY